jgi:uncharacterized membrane protein YagU involved in acid resistance
MAIAYILGTFVCMLALVACILIACYSLARGLWSGALVGALAAILALTFMLDCIAGVERAYDALKIERVAQGLDQ